MNILTFDVEEWFHILDNDTTKTENDWASYSYRLDENMERIFQLLEEHDQKATFFCLGWVAREFPHILQKIDKMGFEIATHSDLHQLAFEQSEYEFENDLESSIKSIEDIVGKKVNTYRAPGFSIKQENKWVFNSLLKYGIEIDCSVFPAKRSHGGFESYGHAAPSLIDIDGLQLKEFPINLFEIGGGGIIFSGGGYFRILPYWVVKYMMNKSDYVMTYFHPRDFDSKQPVIKDLPLTRKFKSYVGLNTAFDKLEKLISDYDFIDVKQANAITDWDSKKVIEL